MMIIPTISTITIKKIFILLLLSILLLSCSKKKESEYLVLGTYDAFPPFSYNARESGYMLAGFDIELARIIAEKYGKTLQIETMDFNRLITSVENGTIDIAMCGITITEARKARVNFSSAYYASARAVVIRKEDLRGLSLIIKTKEDLGVKVRLGSQSGTVGNAIAREIALGRSVVEKESWELLISELVHKNIDAVILEKGIADLIVSKYNALTILPLDFPAEYYGAAIQKGNRKLLSSVNRTIYELMLSGEYYDLVEDNILSYSPE